MKFTLGAAFTTADNFITINSYDFNDYYYSSISCSYESADNYSWVACVTETRE